MIEHGHDELLTRLARLERSNRRLAGGFAAAILVLGALGVMGQAGGPAKTVEAERFVLRDASGRVRGELVADSKRTSFSLMAPGGRRAGHVEVDDTTTLLAFHNPRASWIFTLAPPPIGNAIALLVDERPRLTVGESSVVRGLGLQLWDDTKNVRASLATAATGEAALYFYDAAGQARLGLDQIGDMGRLRFLDERGDFRLAAQYSSKATGILMKGLGDASASWLMLPTGMPSIRFQNQAGQTVWQAP